MTGRRSNARTKTGGERRSNARETAPREHPPNASVIADLGPAPWTYSGNPGASDKDAVRFEIQDTDSQAQLIADAEINYALSVEAGPAPRAQIGIFAASARCLEVLARRFAAQADQTVGSLQVTYSKQAVTYAQRAAELRVKAQGLHAPWAGGMSISEKQARLDDQDVVQPAFARDQFRSPWTGPRAPQFPVSDDQRG